MIRAIILDVDGIVIGERIGFNSPHPHPDVLQALNKIRKKNIPITLCTAKPPFSITDIIDGAQLNNIHITDGGAVLIDPIDRTILEELTIEKSLAKEILQSLIQHNIYTEFYTTEDYFIQKNQIAEVTQKHRHILQKNAKILLDIPEESVNFSITKIMPIADNIQHVTGISELLKPFEEKVSISWAVHPVALPHQFGIIVNKKTSKKTAALKILQSLNIPPENVLGIGDSTSDWKFIEPLGYGATLENGTDEIKKLLQTKKEGNFFIGKSVDENGLLDILSFFFS